MNICLYSTRVYIINRFHLSRLLNPMQKYLRFFAKLKGIASQFISSRARKVSKNGGGRILSGSQNLVPSPGFWSRSRELLWQIFVGAYYPCFDKNGSGLCCQPTVDYFFDLGFSKVLIGLLVGTLDAVPCSPGCFRALRAFQILLDKATLFHGKAPGFQLLCNLTCYQFIIYHNDSSLYCSLTFFLGLCLD